MNLNADIFIKQELVSGEDELIRNFSNTDSNIPVKNEPIEFDETFPFDTIKIEPAPESPYLEDAVTTQPKIPSQDIEIAKEERESFIIYELETPPVQSKLGTLSQQQLNQTFIELPPTKAVTQIKEILTPRKPATVSNSNQNAVKNMKVDRGVGPLTDTTPPPVLLNAQLRKRHKIISSVNPMDKRTRYNIERTTPVLADKSYIIADSAETSNSSRSLNTGIKKIINHLIKQKQRTREEKCLAMESLPNTHNPSAQGIDNLNATTLKETTSNSASPHHAHRTAETTANMSIVAKVLNTFSPTSTSASQIIQKSSKPSTDTATLPELRVKCLCSLTENTPQDHSELKRLFQEMYEETRRLSKAQQRKVKMVLLKSISAAEESVEQGKCCGF